MIGMSPERLQSKISQLAELVGAQDLRACMSVQRPLHVGIRGIRGACWYVLVLPVRVIV
jgi:hypothetical protein